LIEYNNSVKNDAKPFLRWAGGKNWLVKHLSNFIPKTGLNNYHEPFLGGASIFLAINPEVAFLSDLNIELIETYTTLKTDPEGIIDALSSFENTENFYYTIREKRYINLVEKAARFIFMNQTSFNGIYRVNLKGEYNVPYGFRAKAFLDKDGLRQVSCRLKNAILFNGDFSLSKLYIQQGDLVFLDPPYTVSHNTNGFIKYNQKLFSLEDQKRLSDLIDHIRGIGAFYLLTNAAHKTIKEIFEKGDRMLIMNRANLIGGNNAQRGQISEYIFTNLQEKR